MATPERFARLRTLFNDALELDVAEREAFLERECGADDALRSEVRRLLERETQLQGTLTRSPAALVAHGLDATIAELDRAQSFGPFRLQEEIGSGGMGRVFRATRIDGAFEQEVAIKILRRELLNPALLRRFSTERAVLAALDDPCIARLLDAGETPDGTPYVVMEYVRGTSLLAHCDSRRLGVRDRVRLFRRIVGAVAHAHRNLVVHRDLKPGNVLVTDDGIPKLLDFGIAKPLAPDSVATMTADRFFTPAYAAPEQLRGDPITVGCDIYALGVLLYELLTGRLPFDTDRLSAGELERLVVSVPPRPMSVAVTQGDAQRALDRGAAHLRELVRQVRGDLEAIVQRALRKEPAERYRTAEQLDEDLAAFLENRPISVRPNQLAYRARKFVSRHRIAVAIGTVATIGLIATMVTVITQSIAVRQERDRAELAVRFMKDAFASADPGNAAGADVSARRILESARARLDEAFRSRPDLYASLGSTIAEVESAMGMSREAADTAARAIDASRRAGSDPAALRDLLITHARAAITNGDFANAERSLEEAAHLAASGTPAWDVARGRLLSGLGQPVEAIAHLEKAVQRTADLPLSDPLPHEARWALIDAHRKERHFATAIGLLDVTLAWQTSGLPEEHPRIAQTRFRRIDVLRHLERIDEALTEARDVVADIDRHYGSSSSFAASARNVLGSVLWRAKDYAGAAEAYRESMVGWQRIFGDSHQLTLRSRYNFGMALAMIPERRTESEQIHREVTRIASETLGQTHQLSVYFRMNQGNFYLEFKRPYEALDTLWNEEVIAGLSGSLQFNQQEYRRLLRTAVEAAGCEDSAGAETKCGAASRWLRDAD